MSNLALPNSALSIAGLTAYIQDLLEQDDHLRQVWVTGEVSSAAHHRSGLFFTLQDPEARASLNCVVWSSQIDKLATAPEVGEQAIVLGQIRLYPQRGQYQLTVWQVLPAGAGLRALRDRQLRNRLAAEGLFEPERKRALPAHATTVAVVTSPQAAAWGDIQRTLRRRYPGLHVVLSPAIVQGDQAPASIVQAIRRVDQDGRADVLIVSRGGGAIEDLACFNDERVVRAISECVVPVIAGIGHQRDETLADLTADACAHTPTAAAELAVPQLADLTAEHENRAAELLDTLTHRMAREQSRVHSLRDRLRRLHLDRRILQEQQSLTWKRQQLKQNSTLQMQQATQHCQLLRQKLATLDPQAVLKRGYAVVRQEGAIVRSSADLQPDQEVTVLLGQGQVQAKVTKILS